MAIKAKIFITIAQKYGWVAMENLKLKNMTKSAKSTVENPCKNVSQKRGLNRSLVRVAPYAMRQAIQWALFKAGGTIKIEKNSDLFYQRNFGKSRWYRRGGTDALVQRDVMSAFLACYATDKGHDRALLIRKWTTAEALLSGSALCRQEPRKDL